MIITDNNTKYFYFPLSSFSPQLWLAMKADVGGLQMAWLWAAVKS